MAIVIVFQPRDFLIVWISLVVRSTFIGPLIFKVFSVASFGQSAREVDGRVILQKKWDSHGQRGVALPDFNNWTCLVIYATPPTIFRFCNTVWKRLAS